MHQTANSSTKPHLPRPSFWTRFVATFLCMPVKYAHQVPERHWLNHSRLVMFVVLVVLPLSGLSWMHLFSLLIGNHRYADTISVGAGSFMMVVVGLMDSMLCGTLSQHRFTVAASVVFCFRWVFALCAAVSLAGGAVLFIMAPQLDRERATQALSAQESDRKRVNELHDVEGRAKLAAESKDAMAKAKLQQSSVPSVVTQLTARHEECLSKLKTLQDANGARLPDLNGKLTSLRSAYDVADASDGGGELKGRMRAAEMEIEQMKASEHRFAAQCQRLTAQAARELLYHQTQATRQLNEATAMVKESSKALTAATQAADNKLSELQSATSQAWSRNIGAQIKAAWRLVCSEWWAAFIAGVTFIVCLVTELSPMLGKMALRGGALDQLAEFDEEATRQRLETQLRGVVLREEAERGVQPDSLREMEEIIAIRKTAEAVYRNVDQLRESRDHAKRHGDDKGLANDVFEMARDKMRKLVLRSGNA